MRSNGSAEGHGSGNTGDADMASAVDGAMRLVVSQLLSQRDGLWEDAGVPDQINTSSTSDMNATSHDSRGNGLQTRGSAARGRQGQRTPVPRQPLHAGVQQGRPRAQASDSARHAFYQPSPVLQRPNAARGHERHGTAVNDRTRPAASGTPAPPHVVHAHANPHVMARPAASGAPASPPIVNPHPRIRTRPAVHGALLGAQPLIRVWDPPSSTPAPPRIARATPDPGAPVLSREEARAQVRARVEAMVARSPSSSSSGASAQAPRTQQQSAAEQKAKQTQKAAAPPESAASPPPRIFPVPSAFVCPITLSLMKDPVVCSDGHSFERSAIVEHINHRHALGLQVRSPMTNMPMGAAYTPNHTLKKAINDWVDEEKRRRQQQQQQQGKEGEGKEGETSSNSAQGSELAELRRRYDELRQEHQAYTKAFPELHRLWQRRRKYHLEEIRSIVCVLCIVAILLKLLQDAAGFVNSWTTRT